MLTKVLSVLSQTLLPSNSFTFFFHHYVERTQVLHVRSAQLTSYQKRTGWCCTGQHGIAGRDAVGMFQHVLRCNALSSIQMQYSLQQVHRYQVNGSIATHSIVQISMAHAKGRPNGGPPEPLMRRNRHTLVSPFKL